MNGNNIEYITHKIINGDVPVTPTKDWHHNLEDDLRNTWLPRVGDVENVVTAISYKKDAAYYTLFRKVQTSRDGDFQFVCVHIPYFMELDMDTLVTALEKINTYVKENEIQAPEDSVVEGIVNEIKVINNNIVPPTSYMRGDGYAYRRIGGLMNYKYADIIKGQNQSEYNQYGVLFVVGKNISPIGIDDNADLTNKEIKNHVWFSKSQLVGLEDGVSVYYGDNPFDSPIMVESNGQIALTFKKKGFIEQRKTISVSNGEIGGITWRCRVTNEMFDVRDENNRQIASFNVYLVGDRKLPQELFESELKVEQKVKITADGYEKNEKKVVIRPGAKVADTFVMKLKPTTCYIALKNGLNAEISLNSANREKLRITGSPILGYYAKKDNFSGDIYFKPEPSLVDFLKKQNLSVFKRIMKIALPILLMLLVFCGGFAAGHLLSEKTNSAKITELESRINELQSDKTSEKAPVATVNEEKQKGKDLDAANKYLSENNVWNREAMEKIVPLRGVWDAMNTYNYEAIKKADNDYHFEAQKWQDLIKAITDGSAKPKETNSSFCGDPNDFDITVANYLNVIKASPLTPNATSAGTKKKNTTAKTKDKSSENNLID